MADNQYFPGTNLFPGAPFLQPRSSGPHLGVDFKNGGHAAGVSIGALSDGVAIVKMDAKGYGMWVAVQHHGVDGTIITDVYAHVVPSVRDGEKIFRGQIIGTVGTETELRSEGGTLNGNFDGAHLTA